MERTHPAVEPSAHSPRPINRRNRTRLGVHSTRRSRAVAGMVVLALAALLLGACGGGVPGTQPTAVPTADSAATTAPATQVEWTDSVVRIVAAGKFIDPTIGSKLSVGSGSGFIIDSSGLVVTNNHVVGGAGLVRVYIPGEDEPRTGRVIGISECSDLAIVRIHGEGEFPALEWYQGGIRPDLNVRKGGYPGGSETVNIQSGIVSQLDINLQTEWASVSKALLHSAKILEGDSGGVLVTDVDGQMQVVAVNFASKNDDDRNYAIGRDEARKVIEQLRASETDRNVALAGAIGINGVAVTGKVGDQEVSGIWVRSVISGSPADAVRLRAGDLITTMEGIPLATDGTMETYCEFVHDRHTQPLNIEVLRLGTGELLEGQVNTEGRELTVIAPGLSIQPTPVAATAVPATAVPVATGINLDPTQAQIDAFWNQAQQRFQSQVELVNESFNDPRSIARWPLQPGATGFPRIQNERFEHTPQGGTEFRGPQINGAAGRINGDFAIQADIAVQPGGLTSGALIFGLSDTLISEFHVHNDGTWSLDTFNSQRSEWLSDYTVDNIPSSAIKPAGAYNQLSIIRVGNTVELIINDQVVALMTDSPAVEGIFGIGVRKAGREAATEVWIDNFLVIQAN